MIWVSKKFFAFFSSLARRIAAPVRLISFPLSVGLIVFIVGLMTSSIVFFSLWRGAVKQLADPAALVRREAQSIAARAGELMDLPATEEPTVATVTDVTRLRDPFFAKAKNGDRVLFYTKERLVVLYDPVANKIVNVGSVAPESSSSAQTVGNSSVRARFQPGIQ